MVSNHKLSHDKEVEKEDHYLNWKIKVNDGTTLTVNSEDLLTLLEGTNMTITRSANGITFNANIPNTDKLNKIITSSTYTIDAADKTKWLIFTNNCTVTISPGLNTPNLFEGEAYNNATVTFVAGNGVALRHVASISKILSPNGVFGIRFKALNDCILYGTDPVNYLNQ